MAVTIAERILNWVESLDENWEIPDPFEIIFPYEKDETITAMNAFYQKYYDDQHERILIFGINPGRFGAGITGIPFTDPIRLETDCGIDNPWKKRPELSSEFVYEFINGFGGPASFYRHFYITSISPLGFLYEGKNCNYYDNKSLQDSLEEKIKEHILGQIEIGGSSKVAICLGQGKNFKYFNKLNEELNSFEEIIPLPHPRWVMQYRRKQKNAFTQSFIQTFRHCIEATNKNSKPV